MLRGYEFCLAPEELQTHSTPPPPPSTTYKAVFALVLTVHKLSFDIMELIVRIIMFKPKAYYFFYKWVSFKSPKSGDQDDFASYNF